MENNVIAVDFKKQELKFGDTVYVNSGACRGQIRFVVGIAPSEYSNNVVCVLSNYLGSTIRLISPLLIKVEPSYESS